MAITIEHRAAASELCHECAIAPLVEVPAGLLASIGIGEIVRPVFHHGHARRHFASHGPYILIQSLQCPRRRIVAKDNLPGRNHFIERLQHWFGQSLHACGCDLHHAGVVESIDRQSGQAIAFCVNKAIIVFAEQRRPASQRAGEMRGEEGIADLCVRNGIQ